MGLNKDTASFIVKEATRLMDQNICILSTDGEVLASLRLDDVGLFIHECQSVAASGDIIVLNPAVSPFWTGVAFPLYELNNVIAICVLKDVKKVDRSFLNLLEFSLETMIDKATSVNAGIYKRRIIESWIVNLFDPDYSDFSELETSAADIGLDTHASSRVVVIHVSSKRVGSTTALNADASFVENFILQNIISIIHVNFYCYLGRNLYAFCIGASPLRTFSQNHVRDELMNAFDILATKLEQINMSCTVGIGSVRDNLKGYRESFQEANRCVNLAVRFNKTNPTVLADWDLLNFIYQIPQPVLFSFVSQYYKGEEDLKDDMIQTIDTYFKNSCAVQKTADDLNVHKNTLLYRFHRIKEAVGLDPQDFHDAVILELWLRIRELYPEMIDQFAKNKGHTNYMN